MIFQKCNSSKYFDFQRIRKVNPLLREEIFESMNNHLSKKLGGVIFNNKNSLKEAYQD